MDKLSNGACEAALGSGVDWGLRSGSLLKRDDNDFWWKKSSTDRSSHFNGNCLVTASFLLNERFFSVIHSNNLRNLRKSHCSLRSCRRNSGRLCDLRIHWLTDHRRRCLNYWIALLNCPRWPTWAVWSTWFWLDENALAAEEGGTGTSDNVGSPGSWTLRNFDEKNCKKFENSRILSSPLIIKVKYDNDTDEENDSTNNTNGDCGCWSSLKKIQTIINSYF